MWFVAVLTYTCIRCHLQLTMRRSTCIVRSLRDGVHYFTPSCAKCKGVSNANAKTKHTRRQRRQRLSGGWRWWDERGERSSWDRRGGSRCDRGRGERRRRRCSKRRSRQRRRRQRRTRGDVVVCHIPHHLIRDLGENLGRQLNGIAAKTLKRNELSTCQRLTTRLA